MKREPTTGAAQALDRAALVGASLASTDVLLTYLTGNAPARDAIGIAGVPFLLALALGLLLRRLSPALGELGLLGVPILLLGLRGCVVGCGVEGTALLLRWLPTAVLLSAATVLALRWPSAGTAVFGIRAVVLNLAAAAAFGLRTDQYPAFDLRVGGATIAAAAVAIGILWSSRARAPRTVVRRSTVAAAACCVVVAFCGRSSAPWLDGTRGAGVLAATRARPNVVLVVMDTVRADHLGLYEYPRPTSPNLDALAQRSMVFTRARANATYSLASHASLFTGMRPAEHGAHQIPPGWGRDHPGLNLAVGSFGLRKHVDTLADDLRARGYRTGGISANDVYLGRWTGLQRGFDEFHATARRRYRYAPLAVTVMARAAPALGWDFNLQDTWPAETVVDAALGWSRSSPQPFFLFLNLFDAHSPYAPRGGSRFRGDGVGRDEHLIPEYDEEIRRVDEQIGRLLTGLQAGGLLESTIVVVTADHGEFFGEHGLQGHPSVLGEPVLRVPLILSAPGLDPGRNDANIGLHRVRGMVRALVDGSKTDTTFAATPGPRVIAESWAGYRGNPDPARLQPAAIAVYDGPLKLLRHTGPDEEQLFDLTQDPAETRNIVSTPHSRALREAADAYLGRDAAEPHVAPASEDALERLRALGYVQ